MLNIIVSVIIWSVVVIGICRVFSAGGVVFGDGKVTGWLCKPAKTYQSYEPSKKDYAKVAGGALFFRLGVYAISILAMRIFLDDSTSLTIEQIKNYWVQWDANHYIKIATNGYSGSIENGQHLFLVFFPLYAWLIKGANLLFHNIYIAGFVVSNLCYIIGCCYFYAAVALDYGKGIAKKAVIYISVFPFAFFFGGMMTESLFFLLVVACFYYIKRHKWWLVALTGLLAGLTRMMGVLLILPAFLEWVEYYKPFALMKEKKWKELWRAFYSKLLWIALMFIGPLIYLYINYVVEGDPFRFLYYQKNHWYQQGQYFGKTVTQIWQRAFSPEHMGMARVSIWLPEILLFLFAMLVLVYAVRRHQSKYVLYLVAYLILNYAPTWLISAGRYMAVAVPLFVFMAEFSEEHEWADKWIVVLSSVTFGVYLFGYLMGKQIM